MKKQLSKSVYLCEDDFVEIRMRLNELKAELSELIDIFNRMVSNKRNKIEEIDFVRS